LGEILFLALQNFGRKLFEVDKRGIPDIMRNVRMNTGATTEPLKESPRLMSLDALRGFDMFWILGADALVSALNSLSSNPVIHLISTELDHAEWQGFHFEDLIFPLFVFMMGVSTVFSLTKIMAAEGRHTAVKRVLRRGSLLFLLGLFYYGGFNHPWPDMRLMGVLNRIALCYTIGGLLFIYFRPRTLIAIAAGLLLGYWALMALVSFPDVRPVPGGDTVITKEAGITNTAQLNMASTVRLRGVYIQGVNLANYIDQKYLPGMRWDGTYDPEGILSTMPAVVTGLLGVFAGLLIRNKSVPDLKKVGWLIGAGILSATVGWIWSIEFPVIKKLWTSSYVLVAGGYSAIFLGVFYWMVDVQKWRWWCQPFVWVGMNPITLYVLRELIGGYEAMGQRITGGPIQAFLNAHVVDGFGDLVVALTAIVVLFWFAHFLYKRNILIRL
jgi:predicted acyltransferase